MNRKTKKILTIIFMFWLVLRLPLFLYLLFFSLFYIFLPDILFAIILIAWDFDINLFYLIIQH